MGKSKKIKAAPESASTKALNEANAQLLRTQNDLLTQQASSNAIFTKLAAEEAGFTPIFGNQARFDELTAKQGELGSLSNLSQDAQDAVLGKRPFSPEIGDEVRALHAQFGGDSTVEEFIQQARNNPEGEFSNLTSDEAAELQALGGDAGNLGGITGFDKAPLGEADVLRDEIEVDLLEREKLALAGELPVGQGLLKDLEDRRQTLEAGLLKQLGSGFETSSPGIEALSEFDTGSSALKEAVAKGDIGNFAALQLAQSGFNQGAGNLNLAQLQGGINANAGTINQGFGLSQALIGGQQPDQFTRQLGFNVDQVNAQRGGGFGSVFGALAGAAVGSFAGGAGASFGAKFGSNLFGGTATN